MKGIGKFLLLSGISLVVIGLFYGLVPGSGFENSAGLSIEASETHIFRAIMGLYCGIGGLLIAGAIDQEHTKAALLLETVFFGSIAGGRLVSFAIDGNCHWFALTGVAIEIPLFVLCLALYRKEKIISGQVLNSTL